MSRDLNEVRLIGRLGADPEMRYTPSGSPVANVRLAVNRRQRAAEGEERREPVTDWFTVVFWDRLAEIASQYLKKGARIHVSGRIQVRRYETREGEKRTAMEIVAQDMIMLDAARQDAADGGSARPGDEDDDEEIEDMPF